MDVMVRATNESGAAQAAPRAAVVEDLPELRDLMVEELRMRGCEAVGFESAEALYRYMSVSRLDVIVLDIGLPGENGLDVAAHLRQLSSVGIIVLTGQGGKHLMAQVLKGGADMFLTKPVDYDALSLAVFNLHRRLADQAPPERPRTVEADATWSLADGGWTLLGPGATRLTLNAAERSVLAMLFAQPGTPMPRDGLIEALTDEPEDYDPHRLEVLIHRLRTKAKSAFPDPLPLRSVRGVGYIFTP